MMSVRRGKGVAAARAGRPSTDAFCHRGPPPPAVFLPPPFASPPPVSSRPSVVWPPPVGVPAISRPPPFVSAAAFPPQPCVVLPPPLPQLVSVLPPPQSSEAFFARPPREHCWPRPASRDDHSRRRPAVSTRAEPQGASRLRPFGKSSDLPPWRRRPPPAEASTFHSQRRAGEEANGRRSRRSRSLSAISEASPSPRNRASKRQRRGSSVEKSGAVWRASASEAAAGFTFDVAGDDSLEALLEKGLSASSDLGHSSSGGVCAKGAEKKPRSKSEGKRRRSEFLLWGAGAEAAALSVADAVGEEGLRDFQLISERFVSTLRREGVLKKDPSAASGKRGKGIWASEKQDAKDKSPPRASSEGRSRGAAADAESSSPKLDCLNPKALEKAFSRADSALQELAFTWALVGGSREGRGQSDAWSSKGGRYFAHLQNDEASTVSSSAAPQGRQEASASPTDQEEPQPSAPAALSRGQEQERQGRGAAAAGALPKSESRRPSSSSSRERETSLPQRVPGETLDAAGEQAAPPDEKGAESVAWEVGDFAFLPSPRPPVQEGSGGRRPSPRHPARKPSVLRVTRSRILQSHAFTLAMQMLPKQLCLFCGAQSCPRTADRRVTCRGEKSLQIDLQIEISNPLVQDSAAEF